MNLDLLTIPNDGKVTSNGRRSIVAFDGHAGRQRNPLHRSRANYRAKTRKLRLGHVHIKVRDLNRSVPFYISTLDLRLTEWVGRYAFLTAGNEHHSIALEEIGTWTVQPSRRAVGVAHVAFEVSDRAAFAAMRKRLLDADVPFISRNNGISWAIRFKDPDGHEVEIYVDRRHAPGGTQLWRGHWHGPIKEEPVSVIAATG
jgi:catechol 2,3-dioxygenase